MYNGKSRHIHYRYNIVKHFLSNRIVSIDYVKSNKNIMDPLTKDLSRELVYNSSRGMSLKPLNLKECNDGNHTKLIEDLKIYICSNVKLSHLIFSVALGNYYFLSISMMK